MGKGLVLVNNWCVAPSFFGDNAKDICEEIMHRKLDLLYGE